MIQVQGCRHELPHFVPEERQFQERDVDQQDDQSKESKEEQVCV